MIFDQGLGEAGPQGGLIKCCNFQQTDGIKATWPARKLQKHYELQCLKDEARIGGVAGGQLTRG